MTEREARRRPGEEPSAEVPLVTATAPPTPQARVLELQRTIGNAAVTRLIARADAGTQTPDAGTQTPDAGTPAHDHADDAKDPHLEVEQIARFFPEGSISRKLVYHYGNGSGEDYELSEAEMRELKPYINFFDATKFGQIITVGARQRAFEDSSPSGAPPPGPAVINHKGLAVSQIGGGLGTFTVHVLGELALEPSAKPGEKRAVVTGEMDFYDEWDFDPKPFETLIGTSNRTRMGEAKTIVGATMRGKPFKVRSKPVPVRQSSDDPEAIW